MFYFVSLGKKISKTQAEVLRFWENFLETPSLKSSYMLEMHQFTTFPVIQQVAVVLVPLKCTCLEDVF